MPIRRIGRGFKFSKNIAATNEFKRKAPKVIANNSLNWYLEGFRKEGGQTDDSKKGWAPRGPGAKRNAGRGILIDTGALRRGIRVISTNFKRIIIGTTGIRYADKHNEGLKGTIKREFIGDSKELDKSNKKILIKMLNDIFK